MGFLCFLSSKFASCSYTLFLLVQLQVSYGSFGDSRKVSLCVLILTVGTISIGALYRGV